MKRPNLVHFLAIKTDDYISVKASCTMKEWRGPAVVDLSSFTPKFPIQDFRLLRSSQFRIRLIGLNEEKEQVFKKTYDSDHFGNFNFKIPLYGERKDITVFQAYELKKNKGLQVHLGSFIPIVIQGHKKLIICDFDKTLVDTKYSSTKEVYNSLTKPLSSFPTVTNSVELFTNYISDGYHPFILSASPHFYEDSMRDWLYQNKVFTAGIFLKDYRRVFSIIEGELTPKDLKIQGLYKLNHLLDILMMTGIPNELVLMGDNFESDPIIYLTLYKVLNKEIEPWKLWNSLKKDPSFQFNKKQNSQVLSKFYQLGSMISAREEKCHVKIYIRKKANEKEVSINPVLKLDNNVIELYDGIPTHIKPSEAPVL
ncbi:phosphatase domain-containing protein [Halobacteriovorax sp.]|uniref:phosphatase domain-containing protein n=1 Tax=Halobacteriovorax sp. TaxID=2020862 RepID=UPI0035638AA4